MAHAPDGSRPAAARPRPTAAASGLLGAAERHERLLAALRASLADETLPPLDADVRALIPTVTWAHLAEIMRVTRSAAWRRGLRVPATAVPHQVLWLLVGGDAPSPRQLPGGCHRALVDALQAKIEKQFESEAIAEDKRAKRGSGTFDRPAARARVASRAPWSAPVDASLLRALMADPAGASAALGAALARAASSTGTRACPSHPPVPPSAGAPWAAALGLGLLWCAALPCSAALGFRHIPGRAGLDRVQATTVGLTLTPTPTLTLVPPRAGAPWAAALGLGLLWCAALPCSAALGFRHIPGRAGLDRVQAATVGLTLTPTPTLTRTRTQPKPETPLLGTGGEAAAAPPAAPAVSATVPPPPAPVLPPPAAPAPTPAEQQQGVVGHNTVVMRSHFLHGAAPPAAPPAAKPPAAAPPATAAPSAATPVAPTARKTQRRRPPSKATPSQLASLSRRYETRERDIQSAADERVRRAERRVTDVQAEWGHDQVKRDAEKHELEREGRELRKVVKTQVNASLPEPKP